MAVAGAGHSGTFARGSVGSGVFEEGREGRHGAADYGDVAFDGTVRCQCACICTFVRDCLLQEGNAAGVPGAV